eukprot:363664-Chlamydomonas_euryale.AAC.20
MALPSSEARICPRGTQRRHGAAAVAADTGTGGSGSAAARRVFSAGDGQPAMRTSWYQRGCG